METRGDSESSSAIYFNFNATRPASAGARAEVLVLLVWSEIRRGSVGR